MRRWEADAYRLWAADCLGQGDGRAAAAPAWNRWIRQPFSPEALWIVCKSAVLAMRAPRAVGVEF